MVNTAQQEIESRLGQQHDRIEDVLALLEEGLVETTEEWTRLGCLVADIGAELRTVVMCCGYVVREATHAA